MDSGPMDECRGLTPGLLNPPVKAVCRLAATLLNKTPVARHAQARTGMGTAAMENAPRTLWRPIDFHSHHRKQNTTTHP